MDFVPEIEVEIEKSKISLRGPNFTDDNVVDVLSKLPKCKRLLIRSILLGDKGIKALLSSGVINHVQQLRLDYVNVGDEGALELMRSSASNNLVTLCMCLERLSQDGLIAISKLLPGTKIMNFSVFMNQASLDMRVYEAFHQAALKHKILVNCYVGCMHDEDVDEAVNRIQSVLADNSYNIHIVEAELLRAIKFLELEKNMYNQVKNLSPEILKKFEQFYFHPELRFWLIEKEPKVYRGILNYITDNYFQITEIVCDSLQSDNRSSPSLASLPPEVLREITKFLKITDVKTESE